MKSFSKDKVVPALIKVIIGCAVIAAVWWFVSCRCVDLKFLAPGAIRDYIQSFGRLSALIYIAAYALNTISVLPPIAPLSLTAGLVFGEIWGAVYLMAAAMIGTSATFFISRIFGRDLVSRALKGKFKDLDEKLGKNGFMTVLFFRVVPLVPYEVLNYAGGLSKIKFRDYFMATFLGLIPGVVVAAFFGGSLGEIRGIKDILSPKLLISIGLMAAVIAIPVIYKAISGKKRDVKGSGEEEGVAATPEEVRQMEHMHEKMSYNQINEYIFGGNNLCCQTHFEEELLSKGIAADISLEAERLDNPEGVDYFFWFPWGDNTAPPMRLIEIAMGVLDTLVAGEVKTYVHCKNGHGRTTTFLASYYIHKGMTPEDAISFVLSKRPSAHLNDIQRDFLLEYGKKVLS